MAIFLLCFFACSMLRVSNVCNAAVFSDAVNLENSLKNISWTIKPRLNQADQVNVTILMALNSIQDYDEVSGTLRLVVSYVMNWSDEIRIWDPVNHGNLTSIKIPILDTWIPKVSIRNMISRATILSFDNDVDIKTSFVRYLYTGEAMMIMASLQDFSCNSDVTYFPFDNHACAIQLLTMGYDSDVILLATPVGVVMAYMLPNTEWEISYDLVEASPLEQNMQLIFHFTLRRNPYFLFLNLVLPIIFLSFVNLLVFCIPVNSGERASLAFTVLLTFVVFITMVTAILPASNSISIYNIFLLIQLLCSILITFLAVWSISLFHRCEENDIDDLWPNLLVNILKNKRKLCFTVDKDCRRRNITNITENGTNVIEGLTKRENKDAEQLNTGPEVDDSKLSKKDNFRYSLKRLDNICFNFFLIFLLFQLIIYGIIINYRRLP